MREGQEKVTRRRKFLYTLREKLSKLILSSLL